MERIDRAIDKRTLTETEFIELLEKVGFGPGAVVFVHSSMDQLTRRLPEISPVRVIQTMQHLLGPGGTLLLPTFPFQGLQVHYIEAHDHFDVRRTPSQAGLLTEVFRRMPNVVRSLHPTHPVAAWGEYARALTESHRLGGTFESTSPICKIREYGGLVAGLGVRLSKFTIAHVPEELHPEAQSYCFEPFLRRATIDDGTRTFPYEFRCLRAGIDRHYGRVESVLLREGILKYTSARGLPCATAYADRFINRCLDLIDRGQYLF